MIYSLAGLGNTISVYPINIMFYRTQSMQRSSGYSTQRESGTQTEMPRPESRGGRILILGILGAFILFRRAELALVASSVREYAGGSMDYSKIITIEPGQRGGKPCIRGMRITVSDVLEYLASGMTAEQILSDFPELTGEDIRACLAFAADREKRLTGSVA